MADDNENNEDSWLYGSSNPEPPEEEENGKDSSETDEKSITKNGDTDNDENTQNGENENEVNEEEEIETHHETDDMEEQENEEDSKDKNENDGETDSDSDDDDINVVIGDIKSGPTYNIKQRGTLLVPNTALPVQEKPKQLTGKFSIEEFESVGTINGVHAHEFSIDSLDEKPWRKPGADITDYFNYGFNEDTWRSYCERQKKMRLNESGVGLQGLAVGPTVVPNVGPPPTSINRTLTALANDNSKYSSTIGNLTRRAGPPPGRKMTGSIDVIGGNGISSRRDNEPGQIPKVGVPAKENVIQVMTADRREYSRPGGKFDSSVPPPSFVAGPDQFYDQDPYSYGYEPTQDSQWGTENTNWTPSGIKELTPAVPPTMVPPPMGMPPMGVPTGPMGVMPPMVSNQINVMPPHMGMNIPPPRFMHQPHMGGPGGPNMDRNDRDRDRNDRNERDRDRDIRDRDQNRDMGNMERDEIERPIREREDSREKSQSRDRDREKERRTSKSDRYRDRRRERSRSRDRTTRRRSRSRDRDRRSRDKKKSHRKDKDESD